jgi:DHA1 family tetracycline resistance protein-like MFS transporter
LEAVGREMDHTLRRKLGLLLLFVFLDVLGFSLILPLLPFYAESFGASPTIIGLLLGANALAQLVGSPILGRLSDRFGRRPLLILSIAGTAVSFLLLGLANSLALLFASRVLDGLLGGDISLAQAYITDVTDEENRSRGLGLIGAVFGVGFILGPALGGAMSAGGNYGLPALVAAAISALTLLGVVLWLPESLPPERRSAVAASPRSAFTLEALVEALNRRCVGPLLAATVLFGLAFTMFQTVFALYAERRLDFDAQQTSYVLAYAGVLIAAAQGGAIPALSKRFSDRQLLFAGACLLAVSLGMWAAVGSTVPLLIVLVPITLSGGVLGVSINSVLTKSVYPEEVGGTLGLAAAASGVTRVVAPVLGGYGIDAWGAGAPGVIGTLLCALLAVYAWHRILFVPDLSCPEPA